MANINPADLFILIVDDQPLSRDLVKDILVTMGFVNIHLAETSAQAEAKLAAHPYDVVFVDWMMPGKSGFAMMQAYRQNRAFDHVAFVMVTSQSNEKLMSEAMKAGATAYVLKPAVPSALRPKVEFVLNWVQKVNPRFKKAKA